MEQNHTSIFNGRPNAKAPVSFPSCLEGSTEAWEASLVTFTSGFQSGDATPYVLVFA